MLRANEPERYLPHKTCFKFVTQTTVNTYEPETYFFLIHQVINFSQKTCWPLVNQKHICLINHVKNLSPNPLKKRGSIFPCQGKFKCKSIPKLMDSVRRWVLSKEKLYDSDGVIQIYFQEILSRSFKSIALVSQLSTLYKKWANKSTIV